MRILFLTFLSLMLIFSGCKTSDPESDVTPLIELPSEFSDDPGKEKPRSDWWTFFENQELNNLIQYALDNNFDLISLRTRIAQEEAKVKKERASFFPSLSFSAGGETKDTRTKTSSSGNSTSDGSHSWDASLSGSYTPDIWSEANSQKRSQEFMLEAAKLNLEGSANETASQIAQAWVDIIAVRNKKNILKNQIKINSALFDLQKLRYSNGRASALDVSQQREALAEASSQAPLLEKQEALLLNNLAFLSGRTDAQGLKITTQGLPELPVPEAGIPVNLLENRPDIRAAQMRLLSSRMEVRAAKADMLPSLSLTARAVFSSGDLDLLFQNWVATLAAAIAGPIFDGGLRRAEVERLNAVEKEELNLYTRTVAAAIKEVEDALVSIREQKEYIRLLEEELAVARLTLKDAMVQYRNGQSTYLAYLNAWSSIERLERQLVGEKATYTKDRIILHKVLGWHSISIKEATISKMNDRNGKLKK